MLLRPPLASVLLLLAVALTAAAPAPPPAPVTWAKDIAPLVYQSCAECHHPGGPAPFSLLAYTDARKRARQIAQVTGSRFMPPWLPEPSSGPFVHDRHLTQAQIALFQQWDAAGTPEGDPAAAPLPPTYAPSPLGRADLEVTLPRPYLLSGETTSPYRCFVVPLALSGDKWIHAIDFDPGNGQVVRHATLYADSTGTARRLEAESGAVGYAARDAGLGPNTVPLAEWAVGSGPWVLPPGVAERLPAGSDLVLLLRFEPDGQTETVRPSVRLYYAPHAPQQTPTSLTLGARDLILQPDQKAVVTDTFTLPVAARLLRVTPHAHPVCRALRVTAAPPAGPARHLLQVNDWNADWQDSYRYADPPALPAGTRLSVRWEADDSADNPRNPASPPMAALPGLLYLDDMATVRFQLLPADSADAPALDKAVAASRPPPTVQATAPRRHG